MKTRIGQSSWTRDLPAGLRPRAYRDPLPDRADVVIVGAGLTGCLTAWVLATSTPKRRVVLVDAARVGAGPSALASGFTALPLLGDYRALEKLHGRRLARALMEAVGGATKQLAARLTRGKVAAPVSPRKALRLADVEASQELERERRVREEAGLAATLLAGAAFAKACRAEDAGVALGIDGLGTADPVRALAGAVRRAAAAGVRVIEKAAVTGLAHDRAGAIVQVGDRGIAAGRVILATATAPDLVRPLQRHVHVVHRYAVRTAPLDPAVQKAMALGEAVVGRGAASLLVTTLPGGRLLLAGGDQPPVSGKGEAAAITQRTGQLMYECLRLYPVIAGLQPTEAWTTPIAAAADGWPVIGPHRLFPHHLFAFGTDHDPALAALAASLLARAVADGATRADEAFGFGRL